MYLVVFRNRKRADIDLAAYDAEAMVMETMARSQAGFISFKSYTAADDEVIAVSEWQDEAAARAWGQVAEHRAVQSRGRDLYYDNYTLFGCDEPRVHRFENATDFK